MNQLMVRCGTLFLLSLITFSFAAQRTVTVSGVVVDSVTNQPVQDAIVLLLDTNIADITQIDSIDINSLKPDTAFTGADGAFNKTINASVANFILAFMIVKEGYSIYISGWAMLSNKIDLDTIKLVPADLAEKDTITVSGKVVDSATGQGILDARVGLSGADLDTTGKTVTTDENGNFSHQVIVTKIASLTIIGYVAYKEGYNPAVGSKTATSKTVDLGTIVLSPNTPVVWNPRKQILPRYGAATMTLFSLNGRKLYTGRAARLDRAITRSTNTVLAEFRSNGSIVDLRKVVPAW